MSESDASPEPAMEPPPDRPRRAWPALRTAGRYGLIGALVLAVAGDWLLDRAGALADRVRPATGSTMGLTIGSPTIYTRERLLNDRFEQVAWLDALLRQSAQLVDRTAAAAGDEHPGLDAKAGDEPKAGGDRTASSDRETREQRLRSPRDDFATANGYRDVLRAERAREMLDDSHDMDGNTLYLLSFDATVIPGSNAQGYAAIEATLTRNPDELPDANPAAKDAATARLHELELQDMFDIYAQWLARTRRTLQASVRNVAQPLSTLDPIDERVVPGLLRILTIGACAEIVRLELQADTPKPVPSFEDRQTACGQALDVGSAPADRLDEFRRPALLVRETHKALREIDGLLDIYGRYQAQLRVYDNLKSAAAYLLTVKVPNSVSNPNRYPISQRRPDLVRISTEGVDDKPDREEGTCLDKERNTVDSVVRDGWIVSLMREYGRPNPDDPQSAAFINISHQPGALKVQCRFESLTLAVRAKLLYAITLSGDEPAPPNSPPGSLESWLRLPGGRHVTADALDRASPTCIAAEYVRTNTRQPAAGTQSSYGGSLGQFFDLRLRQRRDLACELSAEPRIGSLARLPAGERPGGTLAPLVAGPAAPVRRAKAEATISGKQPEDANKVRVEDAGVLARVWQDGSWHPVSSEHPLSVQVRSNGLPDYDGGHLTGIRPEDGSGRARSAILTFDARLPRAVKTAALVVSAPDLGDGSRVLGWWKSEGETPNNRLYVEQVTPFRVRGLNGMQQDPSPEHPLAIVLRNCGFPDSVGIVEQLWESPKPDDPGYLVLRPSPQEGPGVHPNNDLGPECRAELEHGRNVLLTLRTLLEGPGYSGRSAVPVTRAVSYGLTPRLRQDITRSDRRADGLQGMFMGLGLHAGDTRSLRRDDSEPEVVGFTRPGLRPDRASARFGWVVTPRHNGAGTWEWSLPIEQLQLGAVVAIPSWWRSALLQVCRRFAPRSEPGAIVTDTFWRHPEDCHLEVLRIPGTANDVSRHLGVEVITTPFVDPPANPDNEMEAGLNLTPTLEAGAGKGPARIVITGDRLWRSTVVTLGAQQANRIEVLPDMSGIIAHFNCVSPPTIFYTPGSNRGAPGYSIAPEDMGAHKEARVENVNGAVVQDMPRTASTGSGPGPALAPMSPVSGDQQAVSGPDSLREVPLTVWTSEGHTNPLSAKIKLSGARACPQPGEPAPSSDRAGQVMSISK